VRGRLATWLGYRLDRFLGLHPALQLGAVLCTGFILALGFGCAIYLAEERSGAVPTVGEGLWWAVTRLLDGGTVSSDSGALRRSFGVGITLLGLVAVAFLTGAFATSFAERIRAIRSGTLPILERRHVLVLGWSSRGGVLVRELAISGLRLTLVIVSPEERDAVEERVKEQLVGIDHRLRIIVRHGDPTTIVAVRRAAAHRAAAVVVLAGADAATSAQADRAAMRTLLALRRVLGTRALPTVVEVSGPAGREMIGLCASRASDRAGHREVAIEARDVNARLLAHAVREAGAFDVARQILSLDGRSIFVHPAARFAGRSFRAAHAAIECGTLVGLVTDGTPVIAPPADRTIERGDRLLVFSDRAGPPSPTGTLPEVEERGSKPRCKPSPHKPLEVLVVRYKPELGVILSTLDETSAVRVTLLVAEGDAAPARAALARLALQRVDVEIVVGDPLDGATLAGLLGRRRDVALLLAPDVPSNEIAEADADQLITLLQIQRHHAGVGRAVVETRSPDTARLAGGVGGPDEVRRVRTDFILSQEVVGMLLAQEVHMISLGLGTSSGRGLLDAVYRDIFDALGPEIQLRPLSQYALGHDLPTFGELAVSALGQGEVALGVAEEGSRPYLLPRREERFAVTDGASLVVLGRVEAPAPIAVPASAELPEPSYPATG
jgi:Trk K+ transport system NAD-binding subunit